MSKQTQKPFACVEQEADVPLTPVFSAHQVVLDCPLDACFTYIYQYEPYLKDSVAFPRVMVSRLQAKPKRDTKYAFDIPPF